MKKLLSFMLALVMVLSMTTAAFADTTYSITIKNNPDTTNVSISGNEYKVFKLFDMTHSADAFADTAAIAYTVDSDFNGFTYEYKETTYSGAATVHPTDANSLITLVSTLEKNSEDLDAFAQAVWEYVVEESIVADASETVEEGKEEVVINPTEAGYYLVYGASTVKTTDNADATVVAACALTNSTYSAEVNVKVEAPKLDKEITNYNEGNKNGSSYNVGDTVDFKLTSEVPVMTGYETYTYIVHDTLSNGLTFNDDVAITVGGTAYTDFTVAKNGQSFDITFNNFIDLAEGDAIEITYSATLDSDALTKDLEKNTVNLEYSNDPYNESSTTKTPDDVVYVYDFDIVIDKYAKGDEAKKLADAKFVLKNAAGKYYSVNATTKVVSWVDAEADATVVTTDANGAASFTGLDAGTYSLKETVAPNGYNLLKDEITVTITPEYNDDGTLKDSASIKQDSANGQYYVESNVENTTGTLLPTTGGIGTVIFYLIGGILVLGSVVLLVTKKRMSATK